MQQKKIVYYDSLGGGRGQYFLDNLLRYIGDEAKTKQNEHFSDKEWELIVEDVPQQQNGNDCGVFTCMFADLVFDDIGVNNLRQIMMEDFRLKICYAILRRQIPYPL